MKRKISFFESTTHSQTASTPACDLEFVPIQDPSFFPGTVEQRVNRQKIVESGSEKTALSASLQDASITDSVLQQVRDLTFEALRLRGRSELYKNLMQENLRLREALMMPPRIQCYPETPAVDNERVLSTLERITNEIETLQKDNEWLQSIMDEIYMQAVLSDLRSFS